MWSKRWMVLIGCWLSACHAEPSAPHPTAVVPSSAHGGAAVPVTVTGRGFAPRVVVGFGSDTQSRVLTDFEVYLDETELGNVTYVDEQTLTATIPAALAPRAYDLVVIDPNGQSGSLEAAYTALPFLCAGRSALPLREICANSADDDCDGETDELDCVPDSPDCTAAWRTPLVVEPGPTAATAGYSVAVVLDHAALVAAGTCRPDGRDLQLYYSGPTGRREIDRVLDPESSWDSSTTTLWFALQRDIPIGRTDTAYAFFHGGASDEPMADEGAVFLSADFFDRPDDEDPGNGWELVEDAGDIDIEANALRFVTTADLNNRPLADRSFPTTTERLSWRFGFDWQRVTTENNYRVHMQLGASEAMELPPPATDYLPNRGVGPSLVWSGPNEGMDGHEGFGYEHGGTLTELATVSGRAIIEAIIDPIEQTFELRIDNAVVGTDLPFTSPQTSLNRMRLFTWQLNQRYFAAPRRFEYSILRLARPGEPMVTPDTSEPSGC